MISAKQIAAFKTALTQAQKVTFLTGAGVSTHSGIPDYRSKNGIYAGISEKPETILSEQTLYQRPELFYRFVMDNMYFPKAQPNEIHRQIAAICRDKGELITQNVDGLDQNAGNPHVTEFHGNLYRIYCTKCHETVTYDAYAQSDRHQNCGGLLRPDIVLYGEPIKAMTLTKALHAVQTADLIVICGTSFVVYPFAQLLANRQPTAAVWALNKTALPASGVKTIIGDALEVFQQL